MHEDRLTLVGPERTKYFAPVAFCGYLIAMCLAIIFTAAFLKDLGEAAAVSAVGAFGLALAAALGVLVLRVQLRELRYVTVETPRQPAENFALVRKLALSLGWRITCEAPADRLEASTPNSMLQQGEIVAVRFRQGQVSIASICNPAVGFSLTGRAHCRRHRERVIEAVVHPTGNGSDPPTRIR